MNATIHRSGGTHNEAGIAMFLGSGGHGGHSPHGSHRPSALAVARSGLNRYVAYYDSILVKPADGDSLRINLTGGFADVIAHKVLTPADTATSFGRAARWLSPPRARIPRP